MFKHVVYIIKENKTYDQVLGDVKNGNGDSSLCVFGEKYTPNTHALVKQFGGMDNFHISGKSSAEGFQIMLKKMYVLGLEVIRIGRKMHWYIIRQVLYGIMH